MPESTNSSNFEEFCQVHGPLLAGMADMGWTASEAIHRALVLYPDLDRDLLERAVHSSHWVFEGRTVQTHSNIFLASALWYAVAAAYELTPDYDYAAIGLDPTIVQDLPRMLETFGVGAQEIAKIIALIGAALKYISNHPYAELDEQTYDDFLAALPEELEQVRRDDFSWPPSRALITDRLGDRSWSRALLKVGICPGDAQEKGIRLDAASLSDRTFRNALGDFLNYCIRYDRKPAVLLYGAWAEDPIRSGAVPHLGAVRAKYGSWHLALHRGRQLINDALKMGGDAALPARVLPSSSPDPTGPLRIEEIQAQGIGVIQPQAPTADQSLEAAWEELTYTLEQRLSALPWSLTLRLYYLASPDSDEGDYAKVLEILRSPAGYFCELTSPEDTGPSAEGFKAEHLRSLGWSEPASGSCWTRNFLSVSKAASGISQALQEATPYQRPDLYQSDDANPSTSALAAHPSTGTLPLLPLPAQEEPGSGNL